MRSLILEAAKEIFLKKGYFETSMRNIAERIEYSPGTLYLYFKDKNEIFHALHEGAFQKLFEQMAPLEFVSDPFERLKAMGKVYMEFARKNKDLYDLMFIEKAPLDIKGDKEKMEMTCRSFHYLQQVISECQAKGRFKGKDLDYLSFLIWAAMHGMCALYSRERMDVITDKDPENIMKHSYQYFVNILETV